MKHASTSQDSRLFGALNCRGVHRAGSQHAVALAQKLLAEQQRRDELEGCAQALGIIYDGGVRDLNQIVEVVRGYGIDLRSEATYGNSTIANALSDLGEREDVILWRCTGATAHGPVDVQLVARYEPVYETVWSIAFEMACDQREIPYSHLRHRRDGAAGDDRSLSPTNDDRLQRALEWILQTAMTVAPP